MAVIEEAKKQPYFKLQTKLKPKTTTLKHQTSETKYWKSYKPIIPTKTLTTSITSLAFSPVAPYNLALSHSAQVSLFSSDIVPKPSLSNFKDVATSPSFRSDGKLLAAGDLSGIVHVFDVKTRSQLRVLKGHGKRAVHTVKYPRGADKMHLFTGGDDAVVRYWDVATETPLLDLTGHRDYVRCGDASPVSDNMFVSGSYDHTIKVWDVRVSNTATSAMSINHGKPVEDVIFLPSGGLVATAGGNSLKIWDLIGGGKLLYSMESHNKTVTSVCVGKIDKESSNEAQQYRLLSVSLDGYMKVFDYAKFKVTCSMRFPSPLLSIAVSPDWSTRVIGTSSGILYAGKRKTKENMGNELVNLTGFGPIAELPKPSLRPSYFRYFHRGQNEKPSEGDYLVNKPKKVKFAEHDKLLKKFRHKEALISALSGKNPESTVAVIEELVARKKLLRCVSNLEGEELGLLLAFLQKYSTVPRYAGLLIKLAKKVVEMRGDDVTNDDVLKGHIRNLKRSVEEEIRIQQSLQEIQGIISPLLKIAGKR